MKAICLGLIAVSLLTLRSSASAQAPESYRGLLAPDIRSGKMQSPDHLKDSIKDGKLSLSLRDAILLTLENNSNIRIEETQVEAQKFTLLGAYQPFDPLIQSTLNVNRYSSPGYSQLQGVGQSTNSTLNALTQSGLLK
jgi:hypothetical protein